MKKKNLLVVCAAAGLCVICVLLLMGSMGIYAEKSGTKKFEPEIAEGGASDTLAQILTENGEGSDVQEEGAATEETLQEIWKKMYKAYAGSEEMKKEVDVQEAFDGADTESIEKTIETEAEKGAAIVEGDSRVVTLSSAELGVHEVGLLVLKEINRLYPKDSLDNLHIDHINLYCDIGTNGQGYSQWEGMLENGYKDNDEGFKSYQFNVDSVTGKIISFGKFHPYQKDKDYTKISWTDEEIKAHAKELIEKYDLALGEELDWNDLELYNGTEEIPSLKEELEVEPDLATAIGNTLIFKKDGKKIFYLNLDWETGEVSEYVWPGRNMPE